MMRICKKAAALLLCVLLIVLCCGCEEEVVLPQNHLFTYALAEEPNNLDPQTARNASAHTVIQNLYEGLCRLDGENNAQPGAAEKWTHNAAHTVFTFTLRANAAWSDGTPVTADDFVFAIKRALNPKTGCAQVEELFCIKGAEEYYYGLSDSAYVGVEAVNSRTVRFTLKESFVDFPAQTAKSAFMPCNEAFFVACGGKYGLESKAMLTNGPFRLRTRSGWVQGEYVRLVRNEHYNGAAAVSPSGVQFRVGDAEDPVDSIVSGAAHVARIPTADVIRAEQAGLQVIAFAETTWGLMINCEKTYFGDALVRRALISAVTRTALADLLPDDAELTANLIPDALTVSGKPYRVPARSCVLPVYEETPRELMAQGLTALGLPKLPAVTVLCVDSAQNRYLVNQLLTDWRSKLGYYFNIETVTDEAELQKRITAGNYQIALAPVQATENDTLSFLQCVTTAARYSSEEFDALAAQVHAEPIKASRAIEDLLLNDAVFIPLYMADTAYALGATVTDLVIHPFNGGLDFRDAGRTA